MSITTKIEDKRSLYYPKDKLIKKQYKYFDWNNIIDIEPELSEVIKNDITVYVANLQKNVGKTYWMIQETNKHVDEIVEDNKLGNKSNKLFGMMFRTRENKNERQTEINSSDLYKWYIKGKHIYSKGTIIDKDEEGNNIYEGRGVHVGTAITFNTMGNSSGAQYENHSNCYYDEYRSKTPLSRPRRDKEFTQWITFLSNFQRGKKDVKLWLFGNNEPGADHLMEGLKIDKNTDYFIDTKVGIFYVNIPNAFSGLELEDNIASKWAEHSDAMGEFLTSNVSLESDKGIVKRSVFKEPKLWGYILYSGQFFKLQIDDEYGFLVEGVEERNWLNDRDHCMTFGITTEDVCFSPYIVVASVQFVKFLMTQFRFNKIKFWQISARDNFVRIWVDGVSSNFYRTELENNIK